jgi:chromosome segregation ATPase
MFTFHIHAPDDTLVLKKLDKILENQTIIINNQTQVQLGIKEIKKMATDLENVVQKISDAVAKETAVDQSVLTLVQQQSQQIKDLAAQLAQTGDINAAVTALNGFADTMSANAQQISDAVTANTPTAPPAPAPTV